MRRTLEAEGVTSRPRAGADARGEMMVDIVDELKSWIDRLQAEARIKRIWVPYPSDEVARIARAIAEIQRLRSLVK
jgi:hypothetical protein